MNVGEFAVRSEKMGTGPVFFRAIHVEVPGKAVYRRLGYREGMTELSSGQREGLERAIAEGAALVELQGSALAIPVAAHGEHGVSLATGDVLRSEKLSKLLEGADEVLFMGATAGRGVVEEIARDTSAGDLSRAVVLDAVASEMTDKALDWIVEYVGGVLRREGKELSSRRFSAGYGDFGLEHQRLMHARLKLSELGVELTPSCVLVPEKSVTAIAGIRWMQPGQTGVL